MSYRRRYSSTIPPRSRRLPRATSWISAVREFTSTPVEYLDKPVLDGPADVLMVCCFGWRESEPGSAVHKLAGAVLAGFARRSTRRSAVSR